MEEKIKNLAGEYKKTQQKVSLRRENWLEKIESKLYNYLKEYSDKLDLDWHVDTNSFRNNHHAVYLSFPPKPSGISGKNINGDQVSAKHYIKEPNYLCYSQTINGKIYVWIHFSFVKEIQAKPNHKKLGYIEPKEIKKDLIKRHVEEFLKEIIEYEKQEDKNPIGFKSNM